MTWTNFIVILSIVYLVYYGLILIFDLLISKKQVDSNIIQDVLTFDEDFPPEVVVPADEEQRPLTKGLEIEPTINRSGSEVYTPEDYESTGAVNLNELFSLAKDNLIQYTSAIPY